MQLKRNRSIRAAGLVLVLLVVGTVPASAQVPQDFTFSGRLVDGSGTPLVGPVDLDMYIMATATGFNPLYGERQHGVTLDAQGNFSVLLGSSFDVFPWGSFDAAILSGAERYVEVQLVAGGIEVLSPRVPLSSVPYALVAQQVANSLTHVRGLVAPSGFVFDCACSATKTGTGQYLVTFDTPFADVPTPIVTSAAAGVARTVAAGIVTTTTVEVATFDSLGALADSGFFLLVVGP